MADIVRFLLLRHLRAEPTSHILHFRGGKLVRSDRGLSFWFLPMSTGIAEVPVDDREQSFLFLGRTADFQEVSVQGAVTFRVADAEALARRIDFGIDLARGRWLREPLERLATIVTQLAQQVTLHYLAHEPVRTVLEEGVQAIRARVEDSLRGSAELAEMGIAVVSVRLSSVAPTAELEKALQAPTREAIQQDADEATFARRALAVEKERAIEENELQNRIELAKREQTLIDQNGLNERRRAEEQTEAERIVVNAKADGTRVAASAEADRIASVDGARNDSERARMAIYADLPKHVMLGMAAREFAKNVKSIEHLNIAPDMLGPLLQNLLFTGTKRLEASE